LREGSRRPAVDYIQSSGYGYNAFTFCAFPDLVIYPEPMPEAKEFAARIDHGGALIPETAKIKLAVEIPVSGVGRLSFAEADKAIKDGKMDLAVFGRQFMADPEFPQKLREGREDEIRLCSRCLHCLHIMWTYQPVQCRCNPFAGNELTMKITPAKKKKKVMVVGAGPAGLEAARVASLRGHEVSIWDKDKELGGATRMAMFIKGEENDHLTEYVSWFDRMLKKQGVKRHLGKAVTAKVVEKENPDVVILAPGAEAVEPEPAGREGREGPDDRRAAEAGGHGAQLVRLEDDVGGHQDLPARRQEDRRDRVGPAGHRGRGVPDETRQAGHRGGRRAGALRRRRHPVDPEARRARRVARAKRDPRDPGRHLQGDLAGRRVDHHGGREDRDHPVRQRAGREQAQEEPGASRRAEGKVKEIHVIGDAMSDKLGYVFGATHSAAELALKI